MSLRTFLAADGTRWSVWHVASGTLRGASGAPRTWLAFVDEWGTERRRLFEVPPNWESLPPERLDLLRRMATASADRAPVAVPEGVHYVPAAATDGRGMATALAFRDRDGTRWEVREIRPSLAERRAGGDRRAAPRRGADRRRTSGARVRMPEPFRHGWLSFRSETEHRRFAPVPRNWLRLTDETLQGLLDAATSVDRSRRTG